MQKAISIGIVNYNGGTYLRKCVLSALKQTTIPVKIIVYDNASTDASIETIADLDNIICIRGTTNNGYAFACNHLLKTMNSEYVVVANMDLEFDQHWCEQVCAAFNSHPEVDAVASLVLEQSDPIKVNFAGIGFFPDLHPQSIFAGKRLDEAPTAPSIVFGAYGAAMAFRRSLFDSVGFFDEDYFLFYEETEFFWRMNLFGRKTIYWPNAQIMHFRSLSTRRFSLLKLYYAERNRLYTGFKLLPIYRYPALFVWSFYRIVIMRMKTDSSQKEKMKETGASFIHIIGTIVSAWLSAFFSFRIIWKKRSRLWADSHATPQDTVAILARYRVPWSVLSLK